MSETIPNPYFDPTKFETLSDHSVFNDAFNLQAELNGRRFATYEEAREEGMEATHLLHGHLEEAGLLAKEVALEGLDIILPTVAIDQTTGDEYLRPTKIDAADDPRADHQPVEGTFYGFQPVIRCDADENGSTDEGNLLDDDEDSDAADAQYRILLHYRICVEERMILNNFVGGAYALGNIATTLMTFTEDKQRAGAANALDALADASDNEAAAHARIKLDELLTPTDDETIYEPHRLQEIDDTLRELERQQGVNAKYRDAALDLLTARLGAYPGSVFTIEAGGFVQKNDTTVFPYDIEGSFAILGIAVVPRFVAKDGKAIRTDTESLAVIIPSTTDGDDVVPCFVPFQSITALDPMEAR